MDRKVDLVSKKGIKPQYFDSIGLKQVMSKRTLKLFLNDILNSTDKISEYSEGLTFGQFLNDNGCCYAQFGNHW